MAADIESLLELVAEPNKETPVNERYMGDFAPTFQAWAIDVAITPGPYATIIASDLYRHFAMWCEEKGIELPPVAPQVFGRSLRKLGLIPGRVTEQRRDNRSYLLDSNSAKRFRAWLKEHPTPPVGQVAIAAGPKRSKPSEP